MSSNQESIASNMATVSAHQYSVLANSCVRPPLDPSTGFSSTVDKRKASQIQKQLDENKTLENVAAAPNDLQRRTPSPPRREGELRKSVQKSQLNPDSYDEFVKMKEENRKMLEACEKMYKQKLMETMSSNASGRTSAVAWLDELFVNGNNEKVMSRTLDDKSHHKLRESFSATKPPSGKPKLSDGMPTKSNVVKSKQAWSTTSEPVWKIPTSVRSSDTDEDALNSNFKKKWSKSGSWDNISLDGHASVSNSRKKNVT